MYLPIRSIVAFVIAILSPILYVKRNQVILPIPAIVTPPSQPIHRLQQYIRIRTDHPNPEYEQAVYFLNRTIAHLIPTAHVSRYEFYSDKPLLLVSIPGTRPSLPSLLLNSHTDVVPAEPSFWQWPPFEARLVLQDSQLRVYGRGTQDMKSIGMQYIEALAQLVAEGWKPKRTVHLSFVPDEEVGGEHGMGLFSKSLVFQNLNVGVAMDEGIPNPESKFSIYYGERRTWWLSIKVTGSPGHGYTIPEQTAASVLHGIVARALYFRNQQFMRIQAGLDIGDAITVNLVYLKSGAPNENSPTGFTMNVIPSVAEAGFDVRVSPKISMEEAEEQISQWLICEDGNQCPGASIKWAQKVTSDVITSRDPKQNPYITAFEAGFASAEIDNRLNHAIFPAATDARFLRDLGIPCFGFSPIEKTPDLLHKHNEFISVDGYLQGVAIYKNVISHLADSHSHEVTHDELPVMESEDASAHTDGKEDL